MRSRRAMGNEGVGWAAWLAIALAGVVLVAAVGLTIYGGRVEPVSRHYEQVVPDDRLPH